MVERRKTLIRKQNLSQETEQEHISEGTDIPSGAGRKTILLLFAVTVGLSLLLWIGQHIAQWLRDFSGPSTWTITR